MTPFIFHHHGDAEDWTPLSHSTTAKPAESRVERVVAVLRRVPAICHHDAERYVLAALSWISASALRDAKRNIEYAADVLREWQGKAIHEYAERAIALVACAELLAVEIAERDAARGAS